MIEPAAVRRKWKLHLAGTEDHKNALWLVLMFQAWLAAQQRPAGQEMFARSEA